MCSVWNVLHLLAYATIPVSLHLNQEELKQKPVIGVILPKKSSGENVSLSQTCNVNLQGILYSVSFNSNKPAFLLNTNLFSLIR